MLMTSIALAPGMASLSMSEYLKVYKRSMAPRAQVTLTPVIYPRVPVSQVAGFFSQVAEQNPPL